MIQVLLYKKLTFIFQKYILPHYLALLLIIEKFCADLVGINQNKILCLSCVDFNPDFSLISFYFWLLVFRFIKNIYHIKLYLLWFGSVYILSVFGLFGFRKKTHKLFMF